MKILKEPTVADWAYAAAMMDGEGSFSITHGTGKSKAGKPYPLFDSKVMISNTSVELMEWLKERFGGYYFESVKHISKKAKANGQNSLRVCYRWISNTYKLQEWFVRGIFPYLVIKQRQAEVALEFLSLFGQKVPEKRKELRETMLALNKVGSPEANTSGVSSGNDEIKIESDLHGDMQSGPEVIPVVTKQHIVDFVKHLEKVSVQPDENGDYIAYAQGPA